MCENRVKQAQKGSIINFKKSIVFKSGIVFVTIMLLVLFVSGYLINKKATTVIKTYNQDRLIHVSNILEKSFYSMLSEVENDISFLSKNIHINNNFQPKTLDTFFYSILSEKPNYFQIRLLDVNNNGLEIVKFIKQDELVEKIPKTNLQFKGAKKYVTSALKVKAPYYFSEINLNEEHQEISKPYRPTLRAIGKLYNTNNTLKYLIIINVDVTSFFNDIKEISKQDILNVVIDVEGDYKYHENFNFSFGKQRNTGSNFFNNYKVKPSILQNNSGKTLVDTNNQVFLYHVKPIQYSSGLNTLYLITLANEKAVLANVNNVNSYSLLTIVIICVVLLLLVCFYAYYFILKLQKVTTAISNYAEADIYENQLAEIKNRSDEIGLLSNAFLQMKAEIDASFKKLKIALQREKEAVEDKKVFLQNMSHELRTPLNAILGLVYLLDKNKPSAKATPIINALGRSANNLKGLMHDILDEQSLLEGKIKLNPTQCNINELLETIISNYTFDAVKKGLKITLNTDKLIRTNSYMLDVLRFEQVVTNLLVNSIKYTLQGQIEVGSSIKNNNLIVWVKDTGLGIKPENLNKIKNRFYRENTNKIKREDSFGLGLSIVKQIIDLFKGELQVQSVFGKGSTFKFIMPIEQVKVKKNKEETQTFLYPTDVKLCKILHIEDDVPSQILISNAFNALSVEVVAINDFEIVNEVLSTANFNLILSDLMLDSKNIITHINSLSAKITTPILAFSALSSKDVETLKVPYIQKPIHLNALIDCAIVLMLKHTYNTPKLENIYEQYDFNKQKITNYLNILNKEFDVYLKRITVVYKSKNNEEWLAIKHKIITHLNSLELFQMKTLFTDAIEDVTPQNFTILTNAIKYIQCYLRNEIRLSLTS